MRPILYIIMKGRFHRPSAERKEDLRELHPDTKRQRLPTGQDDEEERVSKYSAGALPYRLRVRQAADKYAGDRKTKPLPPEKK